MKMRPPSRIKSIAFSSLDAIYSVKLLSSQSPAPGVHIFAVRKVGSGMFNINLAVSSIVRAPL